MMGKIRLDMVRIQYDRYIDPKHLNVRTEPGPFGDQSITKGT
jgi:hypothetical protein